MIRLKDKYKGQTCVVAGNGPSLREVPNDFLHKYPLFGTNRCYLKFIPDFYVVVNPLVIEQNCEQIEALNCTKFVREKMGLYGYQLKRTGKHIFSYEPDKRIYEGYTVTYVCLQLAYFMGFETVLLVGVDHRYTLNGKPNEKKMMEADPNHFDPSYFSGQYWHNADLKNSGEAYELARDAYAKGGKSIINLTRGSALKTFPFGMIEDW